MSATSTMTTLSSDTRAPTSTNVQEAEHVGDVPFIDATAPITTGNEIVAFSTVESPVIESVPARTDISEGVISNIHEGRDHSVKDILCREYAFADFTIPTGGTPGQILATWNPLDIFLQQPNVLDKVSGFAFLRTDLIIRLEFTTLPTVTGGIMLSFYPDLLLAGLTARQQTRLQLSQVPNIQQSLTTAVSMKMRVPWISAFYGRDIANAYGNIGQVVLSRLTPSTINPVSVKAYISAEESALRLQYPTTAEPSTTTFLLMNDVKRRIERLQAMGLSIEELEEMIPRTQSKNSSREASQIRKGGTISGILSAGSKIAQVASGIPVIGGVASAAAPLLGIGSTIAGLFGLSKPPEDKPFCAVKWKPADCHLTSEGLTQSHQFTINSGCSVSSTDVPFGSKADEMAVAAIMQTPNIIGSFNVSTSNPARFVVYQKHLNLFQFERIGVEADRTALFTHQAWVSNLFGMWNATLNFDFDAYITHFHRVKLRFLVLPNVYPPNLVGSVLPATYDINKASSAVVEFSGDNVNWSIQVDPRSNTSMKSTPAHLLTGSGGVPSWVYVNNTLNTVQTSYGTLVVIVEVPLQASANVANNVDFVVNFSAENVELTLPNPSIPWLATTQSKMSTLGTAYAKASRSERMIRGAENLTSNSVDINSYKNVELCAGDSCLHLRNMLNAFVTFANRLTVNGGTRVTWRPFMRRSLADTAGQECDLFDYLVKGYGFFKGGINMRIVIAPLTGADVQVGTAGIVIMDPAWNAIGSGYVPQVGQNTFGGGIVQEAGIRSIPVSMSESPIDLNVPYYQPWHITRCTVNSNASDPRQSYGDMYEMQLTYLAYGNQYVQAYRAVADDFRMGFLMSLPSFKLSDVAQIHT